MTARQRGIRPRRLWRAVPGEVKVLADQDSDGDFQAVCRTLQGIWDVERRRGRVRCSCGRAPCAHTEAVFAALADVVVTASH